MTAVAHAERASSVRVIARTAMAATDAGACARRRRTSPLGATRRFSGVLSVQCETCEREVSVTTQAQQGQRLHRREPRFSRATTPEAMPRCAV